MKCPATNGICVGILLAGLTLPGCSAFLSRPAQAKLDQIAAVDAIELRGSGTNRQIDDPEVIARLRQIYSSAQWKPYVGTLPANMQRIRFLHQGDQVFELAYSGWLMDIDSHDEVRHAAVSGADREWLGRLFASDQVGAPLANE